MAFSNAIRKCRKAHASLLQLVYLAARPPKRIYTDTYIFVYIITHTLRMFITACNALNFRVILTQLVTF